MPRKGRAGPLHESELCSVVLTRPPGRVKDEFYYAREYRPSLPAGAPLSADQVSASPTHDWEDTVLVNALLVLALFSRRVPPLHGGRVRDQPGVRAPQARRRWRRERPDRRVVSEAVLLLGPRSRMCSPRRCTRRPSCTATACRPTALPSSLHLSSRRTSGGRSCTTARREIPRDCVVRSHASVRECPVDLSPHGRKAAARAEEERAEREAAEAELRHAVEAASACRELEPKTNQ